MLRFALPLMIALPAAAQQLPPISVDLGLGVGYSPEYPGSDRLDTKLWPIWRNLALGSSGPREGLAFGPSADANRGRKPSSDERLTGTNRIKAAVELGGQATYRSGPMLGYAALRRGFFGHNGWVGEVGMRYALVQNGPLTLSGGLEAGFASSDYTRTYFGVTAEESAASGMKEYTPKGGLTDVSASLDMRYEFAPDTALLTQLKWGQLQGDAANSPLTFEKTQPRVRVGITRTFRLGQ